MTDRLVIPQANPGASYLAQKGAIDAAIARVLGSGRYILGEPVAAFEQEFAAYLGVKHCVGVASGTDAIELALRALGIGEGQAVIAPSHTAVATVAAIERAGARPVLVDVSRQTYTITPAAIEAIVKSAREIDGCRIAAVIPVHLYGHPANMPAILEVARRHGLRVIEDCAQSHGARIAGQPAGTFGDVAAFSFYPTKNLGAFGDGGFVAVNDAQLQKRLFSLREYGWQQRYVSAFPGLNSRLDPLQAAILSVKLTRLDADNNRRREIAARYSAGLAQLPLALPTSSPGAEHVFHQYVIRTPERDRLSAFLASRSILTGIHYPLPIHLQPAYRDRQLAYGELPETEQLCREILSLPMFPQLADADVDRVIAAIVEWASSRRSVQRGAAT
ncbi:MAG TPA: DegT/DnrJ/EryC1/StrS family aminotransferase [Planctomycetaceae bacterium]|nr:DegT/DnrJ/EryC1/StrS family aminotransferase [Planctomycetaceae bacterium]